MHFALVFYPEVDGVLVDEIRRKHDPTVDLIDPHITVLFPVPERVGESALIEHVRQVLEGFAPFEIQLTGFHRSSDHWLLLILSKGNRKVKELYSALYTGLLEEFRRDDLEFIPHLGLGLFLKEGSTYDWDDPDPDDLDLETCEAVQREVEARGTDWSSFVKTLHLIGIPDEVLEWATGETSDFPVAARVIETRRFALEA